MPVNSGSRPPVVDSHVDGSDAAELAEEKSNPVSIQTIPTISPASADTSVSPDAASRVVPETMSLQRLPLDWVPPPDTTPQSDSGAQKASDSPIALDSARELPVSPRTANDPVVSSLVFRFPRDVADPSNATVQNLQEHLTPPGNAIAHAPIPVPSNAFGLLLPLFSSSFVALAQICVLIVILPLRSPQPTNNKDIAVVGPIAVYMSFFYVCGVLQLYETFERNFFPVDHGKWRRRLSWALLVFTEIVVFNLVTFTIFGTFPFNTLAGIFFAIVLAAPFHFSMIPKQWRAHEGAKARIKAAFDVGGIVAVSVFGTFLFVVLFFSAPADSIEQKLVILSSGAFLCVWRLVTLEFMLFHNLPLALRFSECLQVANNIEIGTAFSLAKIDQPSTFAIFFVVQLSTHFVQPLLMSERFLNLRARVFGKPRTPQTDRDYRERSAVGYCFSLYSHLIASLGFLCLVPIMRSGDNRKHFPFQKVTDTQFDLALYYSAIQAVSVLLQIFIVRWAIKRVFALDVFRLLWWLIKSEWALWYLCFINGFALMAALVLRESNVLFYFAPW